jgi:hypothetical protein
MPYKNSKERKNQLRKYYSENKEKIRVKQKEYREKNKEKLRAKTKEFREKNREKIKKEKQRYFQENKEKINEYRRKNKERTKLHRRKYHVEYEKERKQTDPAYKAMKLSRRRIAHAMKRIGLKKETKIGTFEQRFSCSREVFENRIASQFVNGMTWQNWGTLWQLDHILPLSCAKTLNEVLMLNHYTNLRPLLSIDNKAKGDNLPDVFPEDFPYWAHFLHVFEIT